MSDEERPLETRVEDLFSNAVERQVAERRAVGRALEELGNLVRSLDERLGRLEQADRTRDERLGQLEAAGQAREQELRDSVVGVAEQVERVQAMVREAINEGVDQLNHRQEEGQRALERAVLSSAADKAEGPPIDELAAELARRIAPPPLDVEQIAERLRASQPDVTVDVDRLAGQVAERLAAPAVDVDTLAREVASRLSSPSVDVDRLVDELLPRIKAPAVDVDEVVDLLSVRLRMPSLDVDDLVARLRDVQPSLDVDDLVGRLQDVQPSLDVDDLVARLRDVQPSLDVDDLVARLRDVQPSLDVDDLVARLRDVQPSLDVDDLVGRVETLLASAGGAPDQDAIAERVVERMRQDAPPLDVGLVAQAVVGRLEIPSALQVASAVDASIRDGLESVVDDIRDEVDRVRAELDGIREEVAEGSATSQPLTQRMAAELADVTDALAALRQDLRQADDDRDRLAQSVTGGVERQVSAVLDARLGDLRALLDEQAAGASNLREDVRETLGALRGRIDTLTSDLDGVREIRDTVIEQAERLDRLATELPASSAQLSGRFDEVADAISEQTSQGVSSAFDEVAATVASLSTGIEGLRGDSSRTADRLDEQSAALARMTADLSEFAETVGRTLGEVEVELKAEQDAALERVRELVERAREGVDEAATSLGDGAAAALARVDRAAETVVSSADGLRGRLDAVMDEAAELVRADADLARDEVIAAGARLDLMFDRLSGFERAILEHLVARDGQLVRERQRITAALVEQLTVSVGKRERRKLAAKLEVPPAPVEPLEERPPLAPVTPEPGDRTLDIEVVRPRRRAKAGGDPSPSPAQETPAQDTVADAAGAGPTREELVAIKGLGPAKVDALIEALGSPAAVAAASPDELAAVPGISARLAASIHDALA